MKRPRFMIFIGLILAIAALPWGFDSAYAGPGTLAGRMLRRHRAVVHFTPTAR